MKTHCKSEFCTLKTQNWYYLIAAMISSNFILFGFHNVCSQQKIEEQTFSSNRIISYCHYYHTIILIMFAGYMLKVKCQMLNCKLKKTCNWLVIKCSRKPLIRCIYCRRNCKIESVKSTQHTLNTSFSLHLQWIWYIEDYEAIYYLAKTERVFREYNVANKKSFYNKSSCWCFYWCYWWVLKVWYAKLWQNQ